MFARDLVRPACWLLVVLLLPILSGGRHVAAAAPGAARIAIRGDVMAPSAESRTGATAFLESVLDDYHRGLRAAAGEPAPEPVDSYRTGDDGAFLLVAPEPGMWRVVLEAPGRVPAERRLVPLFEDTTLPAVELPGDAGLSVRVVDPEGRPVPAARVQWTTAATSPAPRELGNRGWSLHARSGSTNAAGRLQLPRAEKEAGELRAWAAGFLPSEPVVVATDDEGPVTLRLSTGRERELRVRDPAGKSLGGVLVTRAGSGVALGTTDAQGRLAAVLPATGAVELVLDAGGGWRRPLTLELREAPPPPPGGADAASSPGEDVIEVTLDAPVLLTGRVVDAESETPLAGALVWPRGEPGAAVTSGDGGGYEMIAGTVPGVVAGAAAGFRTAAVRPGDARAGRVPLLRLPPQVVLAGALTDAEGEPVPGARIRLRAPARPGLTWDGGFGGEAPGATSDDEGRFRAVGLDPGTVYLLRVEAAGFPTLEQAVEPPARLALVLGRGGGLAATVTDPYGEPVAGARVRLFPAPAEAERLTLQLRDGDLLAEHETRSGAAGRFVLRDVAAGVYDLRIDAPGLAPLRRMGVEVPRGELRDLGRLAAAPAVAVAGRVVDSEGEPVAGARVSVDPFSPYRSWRGTRSVYVFSSGVTAPDHQVGGVLSDEEGRFRLGGLASGELVDLDVEHERYQSHSVPGVEPPAEDLEIVLDSGVRVTGRVLDPSGRPVPTAQVRLRGESVIQTSGGTSTHSYSQAEISDQDGRFDVAGLRPGTLRVEAVSGDMTPATAGPFTTENGDLLGPLDLLLGEPAVLQGTLYGLDGEPVPGVEVTARRSTSPDPGVQRTWTRSARTGPAGGYRLPGLAPGEYSLSAETGTARAVARVEMGRDTRRLDLQLEEHRALVGRVIGADGGPAVEPRLEIFSMDGDGDARTAALWGAEDGSFVWSDPPLGAHRIVATAGEERGVLEVEVTERPRRDLVVRLHPGAEVRGRIDGVGPDQVQRVQVSARPVAGGRLRFGRTDHRGDYRVGGLTPGAWTVIADLSGVGRAQGRVDVAEAGETVVLDLELDGGTRVSGRVTLDGAPLAGAHVQLESIDSEALAPRGTDAHHDGSFEIAGLEAGRYRVRVAGDFAAPRWLREVDLSGDEELYLDLVGVAVSGRVLAPDGAPVAGARVALGPPGDDRDTFFVVLHSDDLGLFRFAAALPGSYVLRVEAPGFEPVETPLRVDVLDVGGLEILLRR